MEGKEILYISIVSDILVNINATVDIEIRKLVRLRSDVVGEQRRDWSDLSFGPPRLPLMLDHLIYSLNLTLFSSVKLVPYRSFVTLLLNTTFTLKTLHPSSQPCPHRPHNPPQTPRSPKRQTTPKTHPSQCPPRSSSHTSRATRQKHWRMRASWRFQKVRIYIYISLSFSIYRSISFLLPQHPSIPPL
jgi:hypothetical protein